MKIPFKMSHIEAKSIANWPRYKLKYEFVPFSNTHWHPCQVFWLVSQPIIKGLCFKIHFCSEICIPQGRGDKREYLQISKQSTQNLWPKYSSLVPRRGSALTNFKSLLYRFFTASRPCVKREERKRDDLVASSWEEEEEGPHGHYMWEGRTKKGLSGYPVQVKG